MSITKSVARGLVALAALTAAATGTAGAALPNDQRTILSVGHTDAVNPTFEDGQLRLRVKDDTGPSVVIRDPGDVLFHAKPGSEFPIPDGLSPAWAFLGAPGRILWLLPQIQDPNLLWPGFSSELFPSGVLAGDLMTWRLLSLDGPGDLFVFDVSSFGDPENIEFDTADGLPDAFELPVHAHAHYNWAFTEPGLYKLTFQVDGHRREGGADLSSGPVQYRFYVGDLADLPAEPQTELSIGGAKAAYAVGETIALTAAQNPATAFERYEWLMRCGSLGFAQVGEGATHTLTAERGDDGCQVKVALFDDGGVPVATSAPLRLRIEDAPQQPVVPRSPNPPMQPGTPQRPIVPTRPAAPAALALASVGTHARALTLRLTLAARGSVSVRVLRRGRTLALARPRLLAGGRHVLRVHLPHRLAPGRYTIRVRATAGAKRLTRTIALRVPAA
jgi:surface-anchored protein